MIYDIIASGSAGNAVVVDGSVLIDCGVPYHMLERHVAGLRLVLLTHQHGDHFRPATVARLHRMRPALRWGCCQWMVPHLLSAGVDRRVIDVYEINGMLFMYGNGLAVEPVRLAHNVPNCGYKLRDLGGGSLFYATDTGSLDGVEAKDFDLYLVEGNHREAEIEEKIRQKMETGEFAYEAAARENHLSEEQALAWLAQNMGPESRYVFMHQHRDRGGSHEE